MIRILIADDHAIVRAGLKQFIADEQDMSVVGEATTGQEAIAFVRASECDVVLLDISMPETNGVDTLRQLKQIKPSLPVLILSGYPEKQYALNLLRTGASGYVNKESASEQLVAAIRAVTQGRKYVSPAVAEVLVDDLGGDPNQPPHTSLSEREFQIFCKLAAGKPVSKIADELFLSVKTVSTYRSRILQKMNMKSNADLTYYAIKNQLIQ
ncbi:MAG: response regulator transcription factor [Betaproteobacteria bacterium]